MKLGDQRGETGNWINIKVRDRNGRYGKIIADWNSNWERILTIKFDDEKYNLVLNHSDKDPEDKLNIEWEFSPKEFSGKWAYISDNVTQK